MSTQEQNVWKQGIMIFGLFTLAVVISGVPIAGDLLIGLLVIAAIAMFLNSPVPNMIGGL